MGTDPFIVNDPLYSGQQGYTITPSDSAGLSVVTRAIYIGGSGNISLILAYDSAPVTLNGVVAGSILPLRVKRVMATNTTATNLVAIY